MNALIPVHILTGFLGSGKTTLLNGALRSGFGPETAVVVNEFGDVGLDQLFVQSRSDETVVLKSGCVCCSLRSDLPATLLHLLSLRRDRLQPLQRILIETSGISEPLPILQTLRADFSLRSRFIAGAVVCTVGAVDDVASWDRPEARSQITAADALLITKRDLVGDQTFRSVQDAARERNPLADLLPADSATFVDWLSRYESGEQRAPRGLGRLARRPPSGTGGHGVRSIVIRAPAPPSWPRFAVWLTRLIHLHGDRILRIKGVLFDADRSAWIGVHGVKRFFHPPVHLTLSAPPADGTVLVFITDGLDPERIERAYRALLDPTEGPAGGPLGPG